MPMRNSILITILAALLLVPAGSQLLAEHGSGTVYLNPVLGHWIDYQNPNNLDDGALYGARFGVDLCPVFGLEGFGLVGPSEISPNDQAGATKVGARYSAWGGGFRFMIPAGPVSPYLSAGWGRASMKPDYALSKINGHAVKVDASEKRSLAVYGAGLEVFVHRNVSLRFDAVDHYLKRDFIDGDWRGDRKTHNWEVGAGINLLFGRVRSRQIDSDRDGIPDVNDRCPDTPRGVAVYADGCPLDTDRDGVPDYLDKCPDTPAGTKVDAQGCAAPEPPAPSDADGDGVPDYDDRCPDTPRGVAVKPDGCPLDTDEDGVPDYLDKCPETVKGVKVDAQGCPVVEVASNVVDIYFDLGRALVKREYFSRLDSLARDLAASGESVNVVGFTDQKGTESYNQELSDRRAQAVRDYLVSRGVKADRVRIVGKGKFPLEKTAGAPSSAEQRTATIRMREE